jgi:hypothetical protein
VFGVVYVGLVIVAGFALVIAAQAGRPLLMSLVLLVGAVTLCVLAALHATLQAVYSAALYRYATDHTTPLPGFGPALLESAFSAKQ